MERIDGNTWRTDNGDEVRARGLRLTVEFGEKTKAEVLCAVKAVREENDRLRELVRDMYALIMDGIVYCGDCPRYHECDNGCPEFERRMRNLGVEVTR